MKKLLFPLFALAALTFASCSSDDESEPSGRHYYTIVTDDNSLGKADMNYIANFFTDDVRMFTIDGTKSGADQEAIKRYNDILSQIDNGAVCNAFPSYYDEGLQEYLYYAVHLTRTEGRPDTLASKRWALNGVEEN
jgi:hypothetical protein